MVRILCRRTAKMIFRLLVLALLLWVVYDFRAKMQRTESKEESDEILPYELIDEIASERERIKNLEDLITVMETYHEYPDERCVNVCFQDPAGRYKFDVEYSGELLEYLYAERLRTKAELSRKIKSISN